MTLQNSGQKLKESLKGKGGTVFIVLLLVLLLFRVYVRLAESAGAEKPVKPEIVSLRSGVDRGDDLYKSVKSMLEQWKPFENSDYRTLVRDNPFDSKTVASAKELDDRVEASVMNAIAALDRGDIDEALRLAQEALTIQPKNLRAKQLENKLNALKTTFGGESVVEEDGSTTGG